VNQPTTDVLRCNLPPKEPRYSRTLIRKRSWTGAARRRASGSVHAPHPEPETLGTACSSFRPETRNLFERQGRWVQPRKLNALNAAPPEKKLTRSFPRTPGQVKRGDGPVAVCMAPTRELAAQVTPNPKPSPFSKRSGSGPLRGPLPSEKGTTNKGLRTFTRQTGPESGPDCLTCAEFDSGSGPVAVCMAPTRELAAQVTLNPKPSPFGA